jgi:hypothetical protein
MARVPDRDSLYPDVTVNARSKDYFARHDAILAAALAHVSAPPASPSGQAIVVNWASFRPPQRSVVQMFATGFGPRDALGSAPVSLWIANRPPEFLYSDPAPGVGGLRQSTPGSRRTLRSRIRSRCSFQRGGWSTMALRSTSPIRKRRAITQSTPLWSSVAARIEITFRQVRASAEC